MQAESTLMLCSDANLAGECVFMQYKNNKCQNVPKHLNDKISSVAPSGDGHQCTLFRWGSQKCWQFHLKLRMAASAHLELRDYNCSGPTYQVNAHIDFLSGFNDEMSSFRCSSWMNTNTTKVCLQQRHILLQPTSLCKIGMTGRKWYRMNGCIFSCTMLTGVCFEGQMKSMI